MKKLYIILIVVIAAIAAGFFLGIRMYNKPPAETKNLKPDATVDVAAITAEFKADSAKAFKKYAGMAVIVIKGKVDKVVPAQGKIHINFTANNVNIDCLVAQSDSASASAVKTGQDLTIKGKYSGYTFDEIIDPQPQLHLNDCIIEK